MIFKSNFVQPESFEYISKLSLSEFLPVSHLHFLHLWWYGIHETHTVTAGILKISPDLFLFIISSWVSNRGEWDPVCSEDIVRVFTFQNVHNNITLVRLSWYDLVNFWIGQYFPSTPYLPLGNFGQNYSLKMISEKETAR